MLRDGSSPARVANSSRTQRLDGPSRSATGRNGSSDGAVTCCGVAVNGSMAPVSRGHRSDACRATDAVPTDDRNSGTAASEAAVTAQAPATVARTPGRRSRSTGARRQGAEEIVARAARNRSLMAAAAYRADPAGRPRIRLDIRDVDRHADGQVPEPAQAVAERRAGEHVEGEVGPQVHAGERHRARQGVGGGAPAPGEVGRHDRGEGEGDGGVPGEEAEAGLRGAGAQVGVDEHGVGAAPLDLLLDHLGGEPAADPGDHGADARTPPTPRHPGERRHDPRRERRAELHGRPQHRLERLGEAVHARGRATPPSPGRRPEPARWTPR